jgi:hypothetical protein
MNSHSHWSVSKIKQRDTEVKTHSPCQHLLRIHMSSVATSVPVAARTNTARGPYQGFSHAWSATLIALLSSSIDFGPEVVISS